MSSTSQRPDSQQALLAHYSECETKEHGGCKRCEDASTLRQMHAYYHDRNAPVTDPIRQLVDETIEHRRRVTVKEDRDLRRPLRA